MDDLLNKLIASIADQITETVIAEVDRRLNEQAKTLQVCFSEKEAAAKLNISEITLAKIRKAKEIDYSFAIMPNERGAGGRIVYMIHHLYNFLLRNEVRTGTQVITLTDALNPRNGKLDGLK